MLVSWGNPVPYLKIEDTWKENLMGAKPDNAELFEAIYGIATQSGCEEALFGDSMALAKPAFERMLIGDEFPLTYLEFPLMGKPGFDVSAGYFSVPRGAKFAQGNDCVYQAMIDWVAKVQEEGNYAAICLEADTSTGKPSLAGVYLRQRKKAKLVEPFLTIIGEGARVGSYHDARESLADGWLCEYVGLFPGRAGAPMRIGGYFSEQERLSCAENPQRLAESLNAAGYTWCTDGLLSTGSELMGLAPLADFQFDILADGTLGETFGLSVDFSRVPPWDVRECFEQGFGAQIFSRLEKWGLADGRWKHIPDTVFARCVNYDREDGSTGHLALTISINWAKVKFVAGVPTLAKFYLACKAIDLR